MNCSEESEIIERNNIFTFSVAMILCATIIFGIVKLEKKAEKVNVLQGIVDSLTSNPNYPLEYIELHEITAYNSVEAQTDSEPYLTASGYILDPEEDFKKVCAANHIPFHTKIYIESVGWMVVVDRMHPKNDGKIDIYWGNNIKGAFDFGRQELPVWKLR